MVVDQTMWETNLVNLRTVANLIFLEEQRWTTGIKIPGDFEAVYGRLSHF